MKKRKLRFIAAWVLSLAMTAGGVYRSGIGARADEHAPISGGDSVTYVWDDYGAYVYDAMTDPAENGSNQYGAVTVYGECSFNIGDGVTATVASLDIKAGGAIEIKASGKLVCSDITAEDGAFLFLDNDQNMSGDFFKADGSQIDSWGARKAFKRENGKWCMEEDRAAAFIEGWILAYYDDNAAGNASDDDKKGNVKDRMATELWTEAKEGSGPHKGDFDGIFTTIGEFRDKITIGGYYVEGGIGDRPYYEFTVDLGDSGTANGMITVLEHPKDFGVMIGNEVHFVNSEERDSNGNMYLETGENLNNTEIRIFGNGVCSSEKRSGDSGFKAYQITQEHSGLAGDSTIGGTGGDLLIVPGTASPIEMKGEVNAAAWDYELIPVFATSPSSSAPAVAEVYYGNDGTPGKEVSISRGVAIAGGRSVAGVAVDTTKISGSVASIDGSDPSAFKIVSNSNYDRIPLVVTYSDGSRGYVEIRRVGLKITDKNISGGQCTVEHGTDHSSDYPVSGEKCVTASFYYNTGSVKPTTDHVKLFVTVETTAGVTHQVVERVNSDFVQASQGTDKYADDFVVWSGSDAAYGQLKSVSAIVYDAGNDDSFGGVRVGSGLGVTWSK